MGVKQAQGGSLFLPNYREPEPGTVFSKLY